MPLIASGLTTACPPFDECDIDLDDLGVHREQVVG
jgi:hypothetical protein